MKKKREVKYSMREIGKAFDTSMECISADKFAKSVASQLFRHALRAQKRKAKVRG